MIFAVLSRWFFGLGKEQHALVGPAAVHDDDDDETRLWSLHGYLVNNQDFGRAALV